MFFQIILRTSNDGGGDDAVAVLVLAVNVFIQLFYVVVMMVVVMMLMDVMVLVMFNPFLRQILLHFDRLCEVLLLLLLLLLILVMMVGMQQLLLLLLLQSAVCRLEREIPEKFCGFHPILYFFSSGSSSSLSVAMLHQLIPIFQPLHLRFLPRLAQPSSSSSSSSAATNVRRR